MPPKREKIYPKREKIYPKREKIHPKMGNPVASPAYTIESLDNDQITPS